MDPRKPVDCIGKRVCVIGLGNTACELAVELSKPGVASEVLLSCRSGQTFLPKLVAPVPHPSEPLTGLLRWLPDPIMLASLIALRNRCSSMSSVAYGCGS